MDSCKYCKRYHPEFEMCDEYIEWLRRKTAKVTGGVISDFIGDRQCITHHNACDCREAMFKKLRTENTKLREALTVISTQARWKGYPTPQEWETIVVQQAKAMAEIKD